MTQFDGDAVDDRGGGFRLLEPGTYPMTIQSVTVGMTRNQNHKWTVKLVSADGKNWVYDDIIWTAKAAWRAKQFLKCCEMYKDGSNDYNPKLFEGKLVLVKIIIEPIRWGKYEGRDGNKVAPDGWHTYDKELSKPAAAEADKTDIPF